ncbi:hypothetical protein JCM14244_10590 [Venenivibrio stagnispumantis]|uniref:Uncharacterized protein n=1 Tax=Venenivibrio stagnispumantis TaxID=407998 RepID=A0AA45WKL8_9AQUI|nr:hypothetical protein [Venenivibrio stagnispumantis]MCW4573034.1 hypothetical protein [Venenivibrio stagnispumantis]SMP07465.1 hypothetical protein SAMN06264868_10535 [Venenivibrio stagnispumantis]
MLDLKLNELMMETKLALKLGKIDTAKKHAQEIIDYINEKNLKGLPYDKAKYFAEVVLEIEE